MPERSTETIITFANAFHIKGLDHPQMPGQYLVVTEEVLLEGLSFPVWQRTATLMHLPAITAPAVMRQVFRIDAEDLVAAMAADGKPGADQRIDPRH